MFLQSHFIRTRAGILKHPHSSFILHYQVGLEDFIRVCRHDPRLRQTMEFAIPTNYVGKTMEAVMFQPGGVFNVRIPYCESAVWAKC